MGKSQGNSKKKLGVTTSNAKVKNKEANKKNRGSYRVEKEIRRANRIKEAAPKVTTLIGGEQVEVSTKTKQGKKILDKMKRRAKSTKQSLKNEVRHAGIGNQDDLRAILSGKKVGITTTQLEKKFEAESAQKKADKKAQRTGASGQQRGQSMNDDEEESDDAEEEESSDTDLESIDPTKLTPAQRQIYEMKMRLKKIEQLDSQIEDIKTFKEQKAAKKQQKQQEKQQRLERKQQRIKENKDYSDEEEMNTSIFSMGGDDSDDDARHNGVDSDEYDDDSDGMDEFGDDDEDDFDDEDDYDEDDSDMEDSDVDINDNAAKYKDIYRQLKNQITFAKNEKKAVREEMLSQLYNDLPIYKPMPAKVVGLLKSKGQNVKEIEQKRKEEHEEKIKKIINQRQKQILEYDSDDEDSGSDSAENSDDDYINFMLKRAKKVVNEDGEEEEVEPQADIEKAVSLVKLKQQTKQERNQQRKEMEKLWLEQREERIQQAKERAKEGGKNKKTVEEDDNDDEMVDEPSPTTTTAQKNKSQQEQTASTDATSAKAALSAAKLGSASALTLKKQQLQEQQKKDKEIAERSEHRMMVLLDDGTWGYREGEKQDDGVDLKQKQVDLSSYVRLSKKEKRQQAKAAERAEKEAQMDPEELKRIAEQKERDIIAEERRKDLLERAEAVLAPKLTKKEQNAKMNDDLNDLLDDMEDGDDEDDDDEDEDEEDLEFESDDEDVMDESAELKLLKKQLFSIESHHENRLERIKQVQLILAQLCTELLQNPHKHVPGGHLAALMKLAGDSDNTVKQLAIASAAQVFGDILPQYRIKMHKSTTHAGDVKLSKDVRAMRTYENALLKEYKKLLDIYFQLIHKGMNVFYGRQHKLWLEYQRQQREEQSGKKGGNSAEEQKQKEQEEKQSPYYQYLTSKVEDNELITEKQSTLYIVALKSACNLFSKTYNFNYNTQFASLLSIVLTSDYPEWAAIVTECITEVFKMDKVGDATLEIVKTIGDVCKKRVGEKIRSPLLAVLLDIPFNANIIKYQDLNKAKKEAEAKKLKEQKKKGDKIKGTVGAGHHFWMAQQDKKELSRKQLKKAMKSGKGDTVDDLLAKANAAKADHNSDVKGSLAESEAILSIDARQKTQTQVLSIVFTIFFRYLKQAPTIKTLYNYNSVNNTHNQEYQNLKTQLVKEAGTNTVLAPQVMLTKKEKEASPTDSQVVLTQTMLGIVTPPSHFVLNIVVKGIMQFGSLINIELVLDIFKHLLDVIQAATSLESLPIQSSLLTVQCIFSLLQMHNNSIDIDLAPYYQTLYNVLWQLMYQPEYTFLCIKCVELSILQRKHLPYRRVASIVRRLYQVASHLAPQYALPLLQCVSQCATAHTIVGAMYDNDRLQSGTYDLEAPNPDTADAVATPSWEALAQSASYHPYANIINLHSLLSDLRLGDNKNNDGKLVGNGVDRSTLSLTLSTVEVPDETNKLEKPRRVVREMAICRLKPKELYTALDISKGGFVPDVEKPDAKKLKRAVHNEWYRKDGWLNQVAEMKEGGVYDDFDLRYQSQLLNQILGEKDTVTSFLLNTDEHTRCYGWSDEEEDDYGDEDDEWDSEEGDEMM